MQHLQTTFFAIFLLIVSSRIYAQNIVLLEKGIEKLINGKDHFINGNPEKALADFEECSGIAGIIENDSLRAVCLNNQGVIYDVMGDYPSSIQAYEEALRIHTSEANLIEKAQSELNLGIAYKRLGIYDRSMDFLFSAKQFFENQSMKFELASCLNTMGNLFRELGELRKSVEYHQQALRIRRDIKTNKGIAGSLNNLGEVYIEMHQFDSAYKYLGQALVLKREIQEPRLIATTLTNMARMFQESGESEKAMSFTDESLKERRHAADLKGIAASQVQLALNYYDLCDFNNAHIYSDSALQSSIVLKTNDIRIDALKVLLKIYRQTTEFEKAVAVFDQLLEAQQIRLNEEKVRALTASKVKYETEKKSQKIQLLEEQSLAKSARIQARNFFILGLSVVLFLLIILSTIVYRNMQESARTEKKIELLFRELKHRTRNNLSIISGLIRTEQLVVKGKEKEALKVTSERLESIILLHNMLDESADDGSVKIDLRKYLGTLFLQVKHSRGFGLENLKEKVVLEPILMELKRATLVGLIANELLTNCFKYAFKRNPNPSLSFSLIKLKSDFILCVEDNGCQDHIRKDGSQGLGLVDDLVEELSAEFKWEQNGGTLAILTFR